MINIQQTPSLPGIYKITSPTHKVYIGQSINLLSREKHYKNLAVKKQPKIYHSLQKYGWDSHTFEIIELCDINILNEREVYHKLNTLKIFNDDWKMVLFCEIYDKGGGARSEETRRKMSESTKGYIQSEETKLKKNKKLKGMIKPEGFGENVSNKLKGREVTWGHKLGGRNTPRTVLRKPLIQMDKDGEIIKEWESVMEAEKVYGKDKYQDNIGACCRGVQKTAYGFIWKYL
jgi:group I intron endonuclease